ncbi:MAG: class I SAM-dependent methyltransferase [Planctomycetota bacterium]|jgi:2-polyprenyl-6-hydroxyphenyl methylase/3-demethylubiquinone-9 3-methyltransferase
MTGYYDDKLSAQRLRRCYEIAPPRVKQYLEAEIDFVLQCVPRRARVLETGCGYGRVLERLLERTDRVFGVDTSFASLRMAMEILPRTAGPHLALMNAAALGFMDDTFDLVACIQNGISAFKEDPGRLVEEAARVTRPGGRVLFSTYSDRFWEDRLNWFRLQAAEGLLGEIDEQATKDGNIVCKDGFTARTLRPEDFERLASRVSRKFHVFEQDGSSIFCEIMV